MSQERPRAWWRLADSDRELAPISSGPGVHAQACVLASAHPARERAVRVASPDCVA